MIAQADPRTPRVVLVGPPGSGKSTIGRRLARELGLSLYDTDQGIEVDAGRPIPEIFATDGEATFRQIEERIVRRALLAERGVVSLGGGAVLSAATRALLRNRTVVYLEISVGEGLRRTGIRNAGGDPAAAGQARPLLKGADPAAKYRELMRLRRPLYREVATIRVRTDGRSPGRVVSMIMAKLQAQDGGSTLAQPAEPVQQRDSAQPAAPPPRATSRRRRSRRRRKTQQVTGDNTGE